MAYRIVAYIVGFALTQPLRHMHKLAYAEFVQDGARQLKFRERYFDISSQLYAVER